MLKRFKMLNCKPTPIPITIATKLNKEDKGSNINPTLFKRFIITLMYLTTIRQGLV